MGLQHLGGRCNRRIRHGRGPTARLKAAELENTLPLAGRSGGFGVVGGGRVATGGHLILGESEIRPAEHLAGAVAIDHRQGHPGQLLEGLLGEFLPLVGQGLGVCVVDLGAPQAEPPGRWTRFTAAAGGPLQYTGTVGTGASWGKCSRPN